jgi:plastocyanin
LAWLDRVARRCVPAFGLVLVVAACGGASTPSRPVTPVPSGVIAVDAKEYAFTPSTLTVAAGPARFSVRNAGSVEHEFDVYQGDQLLGQITGLTPGVTKELPLTLAAGDYTFICKLSAHEQLGMKGTLTVTGG